MLTATTQIGAAGAAMWFVVAIFAVACLGALIIAAGALREHARARRDVREYRRQRDAHRKLQRDLRNSRPTGHVRRAA